MCILSSRVLSIVEPCFWYLKYIVYFIHYTLHCIVCLFYSILKCTSKRYASQVILTSTKCSQSNWTNIFPLKSFKFKYRIKSSLGNVRGEYDVVHPLTWRLICTLTPMGLLVNMALQFWGCTTSYSPQKLLITCNIYGNFIWNISTLQSDTSTHK